MYKNVNKPPITDPKEEEKQYMFARSVHMGESVGRNACYWVCCGVVQCTTVTAVALEASQIFRKDTVFD